VSELVIDFVGVVPARTGSVVRLMNAMKVVQCTGKIVIRDRRDDEWSDRPRRSRLFETKLRELGG
jgi:hypothetical protein